MDLSAFLLARIAEEEQNQKRWRSVDLDWHAFQCDIHRLDEQKRPYPCDCGVPARVLADCEAKRRIVELHPTWRGTSFAAGSEFGTEVELCRRCDAAERAHDGRAYAPCLTLRLLAAPYADHPDSDLAWAVA